MKIIVKGGKITADFQKSQHSRPLIIVNLKMSQ